MDDDDVIKDELGDDMLDVSLPKKRIPDPLVDDDVYEPEEEVDQEIADEEPEEDEDEMM